MGQTEHSAHSGHSGHIGRQISALRDKLGITQGEVAEMIGISRASLSHYETGRRQPDYDTLQRFAMFFNVTVDYLMGRYGEHRLESDRELEFATSLELSDDRILEEYTLTVDGRELTPEEARRFIAFIRAVRSLGGEQA
jgi:transcriptional regulator with XRE-family HTH domain